MLDKSKISEDQVEVIVEQVAKKSWWKNPAIYVPVITAALSSPVVVQMISSKAGAEPQPEPTPVIRDVDRNRRGPWSWSNKPKPAVVTMATGLLKGPNSKTSVVAALEEGAQLMISNCQQSLMVVDEMEGKWCQGTYKDQTGNPVRGWIFNAYLNTITEDS